MTVFVLLPMASAVVFGFLGAWVSNHKGRAPVEGLVLGVLFSAFGVLIAALLPADADEFTVYVDGSASSSQPEANPSEWTAPRGLLCHYPTEPSGKRCANQATYAVFTNKSNVPHIVRRGEHIEEEERALSATYATIAVRSID
jgi:hypothetical protein